MPEPNPQHIEERRERFVALWRRVRAEVAKAVVGHDAVVDRTLVALFAGGHALLEGVPGLGKTLLVRSLAAALDLRFSRIQFTPDLMPSDILGTSVVVEDAHGRKSFEFQRGPIFGNLVLADEVNRATPKTQSALLEAMQEGAVTIGGATHPLEAPFFVLATQNPIEMEGTYPLPEAQVDRFLLRLEVKAPRREDLVEVLARTTAGADAAPAKVATGADVLAGRAYVREMPCTRGILDFAARLALASAPDAPDAPEVVRRFVRFGASPRGAQALVLAAKATAAARGALCVAYEDVDAVAHPALRHRLILNFEGEAEGVRPGAVVDALLKHVPRSAEMEKATRA